MNYLQSSQEKIMTLKQLQRRVAVWRLHDKSIVFTNGCFDLIHAGHIHLLSTARSFGEVLIVGLNTDQSVNKLKPGRPLQDEGTRALIMASFAFTDAVILFDDETPLQLIKALKPDVLVKGGDYTMENVVGAPEVTNHGGRIELVPLLKSYSTSNIVARIKGSN